jgi:hypothetical protein
MNIEELVKTPEPDLHDGITVTETGKYYSTQDGHTTNQLIHYGEAVIAAVAKRCADLCQQIAYSHQAAPMLGPELNSLNCADAIRREFGEVSNG